MLVNSWSIRLVNVDTLFFFSIFQANNGADHQTQKLSGTAWKKIST